MFAADQTRGGCRDHLTISLERRTRSLQQPPGANHAAHASSSTDTSKHGCLLVVRTALLLPPVTIHERDPHDGRANSQAKKTSTKVRRDHVELYYIGTSSYLCCSSIRKRTSFPTSPPNCACLPTFDLVRLPLFALEAVVRRMTWKQTFFDYPVESSYMGKQRAQGVDEQEAGQ